MARSPFTPLPIPMPINAGLRPASPQIPSLPAPSLSAKEIEAILENNRRTLPYGMPAMPWVEPEEETTNIRISEERVITRHPPSATSSPKAGGAKSGFLKTSPFLVPVRIETDTEPAKAASQPEISPEDTSAASASRTAGRGQPWKIALGLTAGVSAAALLFFL